jgi:hypothetical protein
MILVRMRHDVVDAIVSGGNAGIMSRAEADPRELVVTALGPSLATEYAKPVEGAILVRVKTKLGQVIEMSGICCQV